MKATIGIFAAAFGAVVALQVTLPHEAQATQAVPAAITSYGTSNGDLYVIYADWNGNLCALHYQSSTEEWLGGSVPIEVAPYTAYSAGSPLLSYVDNAGEGRLFYVGEEYLNHGDIIEQIGNPPTETFEDLTSGNGFEAGYGTQPFLAHDNYTIENGRLAPSPLVGFQEPTTSFHHVYYNGFAGYPTSQNQLRELYSTSDSWTDHEIAELPYDTYTYTAALFAPGGLQEIFWTGSGSLYQTWYPGTHDAWETDLTTSSGPAGWLAAYSVNPADNINVVWGEDGTQPYDDYWVWNFPSYPNTWTGFQAYVQELSTTPGAVALNWSDGTGPDGGVFFVGADHNVWLAMYQRAPVNLTSGHPEVTSNVLQNASALSGFLDVNKTLHAFYVDVNGHVDELTCAVSTITYSSAGTWNYLSVGGYDYDEGVAAH